MDTPDSTTTKQCTKCGEQKPIDCFHRNHKHKDGRATICKQCVLARGMEKRREQGISARSYYDHTATDRKCTTCGEVKPANTEFFYMKKSGLLESVCIPCCRNRAAEYAINNREKRSNYERGYREANRDQVRDRRREYYEKNQEELKEYSRQYRKEHKEKVTSYNKAYREVNREKIARTNQKYRIEHRAELADLFRVWAKNNPDKIRANLHRRRTRKLGNGGSCTSDELSAIRAAQTDKQGRLICWRCGKPIKETPHLDHWIPLDKEGSNGAGNLHYMHVRCNLTKAAKHPTEIGRLI